MNWRNLFSSDSCCRCFSFIWLVSLPFSLIKTMAYAVASVEYTINSGVAPTLLYEIPKPSESPVLSLMIKNLRDYYPCVCIQLSAHTTISQAEVAACNPQPLATPLSNLRFHLAFLALDLPPPSTPTLPPPLTDSHPTSNPLPNDPRIDHFNLCQVFRRIGSDLDHDWFGLL